MYAYSLKTTRVKEPDFPYKAKFRSASDVANFAKSLQDSDVEKFLTLFLDAGNKLSCINVVIGTVNKCMPIAREICKHALLSGAVAVILVHNHPSGNLAPSPEDKKFTEETKKACALLEIKVLDHLIISEDGFFSFSEEGLI